MRIRIADFDMQVADFAKADRGIGLRAFQLVVGQMTKQA